jgi:hypothetical protein
MAGASFEVARPLVMSTCRVLHQFRGNGFGHLEIAAVLDFLHFRQIGRK